MVERMLGVKSKNSTLKNLLRFFILFQIFSGIIIAQEETVNVYIPENFKSYQQYFKNINAERLKKINGPFASKIKNIYKDRENLMSEAILDSVYFFDTSVEKHLNGILENIYSTNQLLIQPQNYKFFIKNSILANAGCYGNGTFEINLGLFTLYKTDDELAYVICHEIAHDILDHSYKNIKNVISELNSDSTKSKIKKIEKTKYGQTRAGLSL